MVTSSNQNIEKKLRIRMFVTLALWASVGFVVIALLSTATVETDNAVIAWLGLRFDFVYIIFLLLVSLAFSIFTGKSRGII